MERIIICDGPDKKRLFRGLMQCANKNRPVIFYTPQSEPIIVSENDSEQWVQLRDSIEVFVRKIEAVLLPLPFKRLNDLTIDVMEHQWIISGWISAGDGSFQEVTISYNTRGKIGGMSMHS